MPIRPELRPLYPPNWRELSRRVTFERAGGRCEACARPRLSTLRCLPDGRWFDQAAAEVLGGHRPALWVSDLYGAQQGHAEAWQVCLAHQLRDCQYAIDAGDAVFAPRMKALLLRAVVIARRRHALAKSTRRTYRWRLERDLDAAMALAPATKDGRRLRRRYGKVRSHLFTFLDHPEITADNNSSERELRPTATYRKVTGGFRSDWGAEFYAGIRSVIGTAKRRGVLDISVLRAGFASDAGASRLLLRAALSTL